MKRGDTVLVLRNNTGTALSRGVITSPTHKAVERDLVQRTFTVESTLDGEVCNVTDSDGAQFTFDRLSDVNVVKSS